MIMTILICTNSKMTNSFHLLYRDRCAVIMTLFLASTAVRNFRESIYMVFLYDKQHFLFQFCLIYINLMHSWQIVHVRKNEDAVVLGLTKSS